MLGDNEYHSTSKTSPSNLCFRTLILKVSSKKHLFFCSLIILRRCLKNRTTNWSVRFFYPSIWYKTKQTLLVLLLCLCKSFQRTLSLTALSNLPGGLFCKASAKVYRISVTTKCFGEYFSKNLKITQSLDTNQPKQHPRRLYRTSGSHKNKNSATKPQNKE